MFLLLLMTVLNALAHPFGSKLYGHKTEVWLSAERVEVRYLLEVPTPAMMADLRRFMTDIEQPTQADQDRHTAAIRDELRDGLRLLVDGEPQAWEEVQPEAPSGVGDTRFIAYHVALRSPLPADAQTLNLVNSNWPDERALFATDVYIGPGVVLDASSQIDVDADGHIAYDRGGAWRGEERERELRLAFRVQDGLEGRLITGFRRITQGSTAEFADAAAVLSTAEPEILPSLVKGELTPRAVIVALLLALVLGAAHAFSPGHGKALVAAYLLGERRTIRHALILGGVITVTHTVTVFILGAVALMLSHVMSPEVLLPWMQLASGVLVLGVGGQLLLKRWRSARAAARSVREHHCGDSAADHVHHGHHHHDHHHGHHHGHSSHANHGAHAAAHAREMAEAATPRDLIALGVSGGIAPCPSALVLLLTAISFHRIAFGLVLVTFFSLGLAVVVSAVGIAVVLLGDRVSGRAGDLAVMRLLPSFSAAVITVLGMALTVGGFRAVLGLL